MLKASYKAANKINYAADVFKSKLLKYIQDRFIEERKEMEKLVRQSKRMKKQILSKSFNDIWLKDCVEYIQKYPINRIKFRKQFLAKLIELRLSFSEFNLIKVALEFGDYSIIQEATLDQEKLSYYFWVPLVEEKEMLVAIYFAQLNIDSFDSAIIHRDDIKVITKETINRYAQQRMYYYDIADDENSKRQIEKAWLKKLEKEKYPTIEYDNNMRMKTMNAVFRKKKEYVNRTLYSLYDIVLIKSKNYLCQFEINGTVHYIMNNPNEFIQNEQTDYALKSTDFIKLYSEITTLIEKNKWNMLLSKQQKNILESNNPVIISGRPGTGKTTVIMLKMLSVFLNLQCSKSLQVMKKIDWEYIQHNLNRNELDNLFRIVYTSYNQDDCDQCQMKFTSLLQHEDIKINFQPTQKDFQLCDSFRDVKTYPLFANFRKIMFMIDGSITHQFFSRSNLRKFEQGTLYCQFNSQEYFEYVCNNYIDMNRANESRVEEYLYRSPDINSDKPTINKTECTYNTFLMFYHTLVEKSKQRDERFFKKKPKSPDDLFYKGQYSWLYENLYKLTLKPEEVYGQIYFVIKGSLFSYLSYANCITRDEYHIKLTEVEEECQYSLDERDAIYDVFLLYEQYKTKNNLFDIQDVVNHLIRQIKIELKTIKLIDYLFIDEIQELTENQLFLYVLVSKYPLVFSGDTCQTISRTNRHRIKDIKSIFRYFKEIIPDYPAVKGALLSINYRINASIFKLTTFIANIIKQVVPDTVDKLSDDYSVRITPFIPSKITNINSFIDIIEGRDNDYPQGRNFALCCQHCFICRTPEQAKHLSSKYDDIIYALDIDQCKGLEFELVIVYNFFSSSLFKELWHIIFSAIEVNEICSSRENIKQLLLKEDMTSIGTSIKHLFPNIKDADDNAVIEMIVNYHKNFLIPKIDVEKINKQSLFAFCTELKQFYVMITRAKTFLLLYEEEQDCSPFSFISTKHNIIASDCSLLLNQIKTYFNQSNNEEYSKEEILQKAEREQTASNYAKSIYLYHIINLKQKEIEVLIYSLYEETKSISSKESQYYRDQTTSLLNLINTNRNQFNDNLDILLIEGQCYENLNDHEAAALVYDRAKLYNQSGIIYLNKLKNYSKAFDAYNTIGNYKMCITALELGGYYKKIYEYLNKVKDEIGLNEYSIAYVKYANQYIRMFYQFDNEFNNITLASYINHKNEKLLNRFQDIKGNLNKTLSQFFGKYYRMVINNDSDDKVIDSTDCFVQINPETDRGDHDHIAKVLGDFNFDEDIINIIQCFFQREESSVISTITKLIPEIYYGKSKKFDTKEYYNQALSAHGEKNKTHIQKVYTRIKHGIDTICTQAGIEGEMKYKYIRDITMFVGCFKYAYYSTEQKYVLCSLLLDEKKMKLIKLTNESDITKAICLSAFYRVFIMDISKEMMANSNKPNIKIIEQSIKKLETNLLQANILSKDDHFHKLRDILIDIYVNKSMNKILSSFDEILSNCLLRESIIYSIEKYTKLITHLSIISIFFFLYGNEDWKVDFSPLSDVETYNIYLQLSKKIMQFAFKLSIYSLSDTLSAILLFTLFSPFGVSYCPRIASISPLHLYQNINMCLMNHKAPQFSISSNNTAYLIEKKIKRIFDAKGTTFVIKAKTAYKVFIKYYQCLFNKISLVLLSYISNCNYIQVVNNQMLSYSIIPELYAIENLYKHFKKVNKSFLSQIVNILEDSIYYPLKDSNDKPNNSIKNVANQSKLFYFLLPILTKDNKQMQSYLQPLSTLAYHLSYQLTLKDRFDPKLNLYFLIMSLFDSYNVTYQKIEGRFVFEVDGFNDLFFYNNPNISLDILSLLSTTEYSPMIVLIWIKKLGYQLFNWLNEVIQTELFVYDYNEVLTTFEDNPPTKINETIGEYLKVVTYFMTHFLPKKGVINKQCDSFESKFYEMNVYCLFLSFAGLYYTLKNSKGNTVVDIKSIEMFINCFKTDSDYYKSISSIKDNELLKTPKFIFIKGNDNTCQSEINLIMRRPYDLLSNSHNADNRYQIKTIVTQTKWDEAFELNDSDMNKFLLFKYDNDVEYTQALLYMFDKYSINNDIISKEVKYIGINENDKRIFVDNSLIQDIINGKQEEDDEYNEEDVCFEEEKEGIEYRYREKRDLIIGNKPNAIQQPNQPQISRKVYGGNRYYGHEFMNKENQRMLSNILRDLQDES